VRWRVWSISEQKRSLDAPEFLGVKVRATGITFLLFALHYQEDVFHFSSFDRQKESNSSPANRKFKTPRALYPFPHLLLAIPMYSITQPTKLHPSSPYVHMSLTNLTLPPRTHIRTLMPTRITLLATLATRLLVINQAPNRAAKRLLVHFHKRIANLVQRGVDLVARGAAAKFACHTVAEELHPHVVLLAWAGGQVDAHKVAHVAEFAVVRDVVAVLGECGFG
jgi:hypothetical protein